MRGILLLAVLFSIGIKGVAQHIPMTSFKPKSGTICYANPTDLPSYIPPPKEFIEWRTNQNAKTKTATINVTYVGFTPQAEAAFQYAVDIWSTLLESPVEINILAQWSALGQGVLGGANAGTYFRDFEGTQRHLIWHASALAEKIARKELNEPGTPDIVASFSSSIDWHMDPNTPPPSGKYDLVTVVLHEIGHGLGITRSYTVSGEIGQISEFFGLPVAFETFLENGTGQKLIQNFNSPSADLKNQITSGAIFFNAPLVRASNSGNKANVYAPTIFSGGSSLAHLDETAYNGTPNALMTPFISPQERNHAPGPISMAILEEIGWKSLHIEHTPVPNTENTANPYPVVCKIKTDESYDASSVTLRYKTDTSPYTTILMTPTGNSDEFSATIPSTGSPVTYRYYITAKHSDNRIFKRPGGLYRQGVDSVEQLHIFFEAGPDTKAPFINHEPKPFILASDTKLDVEAIVSDNIGINNVTLEYKINTVSQPTLPMNIKPGTDSTFLATIDFPPATLQHGDIVEYRIVAIDNSVAQNQKSDPSASTYYTLNVVALAATQTSYSNTFNSPSSDFFGNAFSIATPSAFSNGAIHTTHPYADGTGANDESNYIYQLRIPIRIQSQDAFITFDEIVLVEPGETGTVFGDAQFYDYVIVEGSKDGGITWARFLNGYDSRAKSEWLTRYNSLIVGQNSTSVGDPSLFRSRTIDMLSNGNFLANDEVVIRFRLFADQAANGWGWSIDNLKIQVDDIPPVILHNHHNYRVGTVSNIDIASTVTDVNGLNDVSVEYKINGGSLQSSSFVITPGVNVYNLSLTLNPPLTTNGLLEYRIRAKDPNLNERILPATDFFKVPVIDFGVAVDSYVSDFNSSNTDFVGNFFSVTTPTGFVSGGIHSTHPYPNGFGLDKTSDYVYTLKRKIKVSATNPLMVFDEVVIAEYVSSGLKDYVVVEASKDSGTTWLPLVDAYSSNAYNPPNSWTNAFNTSTNGASSMYRPRVLSLTENGNFIAGDEVIIRFRFHATELINGWGFALDNLSIQGEVTGLEETFVLSGLTVSPNPVRGALQIQFENTQQKPGQISIFNLQGQQVFMSTFPSEGSIKRDVQTQAWGTGLYLVKVSIDGKFLIKKVLKIE